jgi:hypothetical protein
MAVNLIDDIGDLEDRVKSILRILLSKLSPIEAKAINGPGDKIRFNLIQ